MMILGLSPLTKVVIADYNASKAATISLHESLRYELDKRCVHRRPITNRHLTLRASYHAPQIRTSLVIPGHIQTPLFSTIRLPSNRLFRFCFPSLEPISVVKAIIRVLDSQHSQTIYLPLFANFTPLLRLFPSFLRDFAQWVALFHTASYPSLTYCVVYECRLRYGKLCQDNRPSRG